MTADVSRKTLAQSNCGASKYTSAFRRRQGEATRQRIFAAALDCIGAGNFRPEAREIAARAGVDPSAVIRHFGALPLLYRVLAREHGAAIAQAAGMATTIDLEDRAHFVWLIMVGQRRALS